MGKKFFLSLAAACWAYAVSAQEHSNLNFPIVDMSAASSHRYFYLYKSKSMAKENAGMLVNVPIWSPIDAECNATVGVLSNTTNNSGRLDVFQDVNRYSQASLLSQTEANVRLCNMVIAPVEYPFLKSVLYSNALLEPAEVFRCFTGVSMYREAFASLNIDYMGAIFAEHVAYLDSELGYPLNKDGKRYECRILQRNDNVDSLVKNSAKILWLVSVKGGHVLSTGTFLYQDQKDTPDFKKIVMDNIDKLKGLKPVQRIGKPALTINIPIFSISFDGFFDDGLCGRVAKFLPTEKDGFQPQDLKTGITPVGQEAILRLLSKEDGQARILIDVAGMGVKAREWYYTYNKERRYLKDSIPILATGVGISGMKSDENGYGDSDELVKNNQNTILNNRHANLSREDIIQIVASQGLVGISLERDKLMGSAMRARYEAALPQSAQRRRIACEAVVANICKFIQVAQTKEAWDMICIASNFDLYGRFIEPYNTTDQLPLLASDLYDFFSHPRAIDGIFTEREIKQFMYNIPARDIVERIMSRNALRFVAKHYPRTAGEKK